MRYLVLLILVFQKYSSMAQTTWPFSVNNNASQEQAFLKSVSNPSIFTDKKVSAGLLYVNRNASAPINAGGFGANFRHSHTNIGIQAWQRGTENLSRQQYQINLGQEISQMFSLGLTAGIHRLSQAQNYGNLNQLTAGVFMSAKPVNDFSASAYWLGFRKNGTEESQQEAGLSINYLASEAARVSILLKSTPNWEPVLGLSVSYTYKKSVMGQVTVSDSPEPLLVNLLLVKSQWSPFLQYRQHTALGAGFAIGLQWSK